MCAQQAESVNLTAGLQGLAWHTGFLEQAEAYEPGTQDPGAGQGPEPGTRGPWRMCVLEP